VLAVNGTANEYWYQNIDNFITKGLQANVDATGKSVSLSAGGAYLGTYNQMSEEKALPAFTWSPEVRGSITYNLKEQGLSVSLFYKYTGKSVMYVIDNTTKEPVQSIMSSYQVADLTVSKNFFHKRLTISTGCKNLFNVNNIASYQAGGAHSGGSGTTAIGMGRYYFLKTEINFSR
jgi:outer membrane receptor for ferrienterochelin and colicins